MRTYVAQGRRAFTLVELVVVVLIIGIIAAVAAPRMFDTAKDARESSTRQSLIVLRDSLELYKSRNSSYPAVGDVKTALKDYLKGPFPSVQIGANQNDLVVVTTQNPISGIEAGGSAWVYNPTTGSISVNEFARFHQFRLFSSCNLDARLSFFSLFLILFSLLLFFRINNFIQKLERTTLR